MFINTIEMDSNQIHSDNIEYDKVLKIAKHLGLEGLGDAYIAGDVQINNLEQVLLKLIKTPNLLPGKFNLALIMRVIKDLIVNSQIGKGAFRVAESHYDLGNELFEIMLDPSMSYTCGLWQDGARNLAQAQEAKLAALCLGLNLKPGQEVLDIGCGWGNFAEYAAKNFGVKVTGLTVSKEQAEYAKKRCAHLPVTILLQDYKTYSGHFDAVVSIEMIEAVGIRNLAGYFKFVENCLQPGGRFALQAISGDVLSFSSKPCADQYMIWLCKHIFPDGYLPKPKDLFARADSNLAIESVRSLSKDYIKTLASWRSNFLAGWPKIEAQYGDKFYRTWLYYLSGCMACFEGNLADVFQIIYRKI